MRDFPSQPVVDNHVTANRAQAVVDVALRAGANIVAALDWNVSDPKALQAKAEAAALAKAKTIAEQMAKRLNTKLGDLVYASNRAHPIGIPTVVFCRVLVPTNIVASRKRLKSSASFGRRLYD